MSRLEWFASLRVALFKVVGFLRPGADDREFDEELQAHLEMAVEDKIRQGLTPKEARRQARVELGNLTLLQEDASSVRGLPWLGNSWLDIKLGFRMLRKSWGLTLVAGFAMTVVIALAAVAFEILGLMSGTDLPLDEGDRIVAVQSWDQESGDGLGTSAADFERWKENLRSVEQTSAFRLAERNLQTLSSGRRGSGNASGEAPGEAVEVAEISASAFQVARVLPALGRTLLPEDELAAADPVVVVSQLAWRNQFQADPSILGRRVRLDGKVHTVVGVMPEGFGFPIAQHYWVPLRIGPDSYAPDAGSDELFVFARLKDDVEIRQAHGELNRLGLLEPVEALEANALEPGLRVIPYAKAFLSDVDSWQVNLAIIIFMMLLIPPCVNIAILVYARTITRQGEFAARYVLGASRFRIVFQLFLEILVLACCAGVVALAIARATVWQVVADRQAAGELPFWMDFGLSVRTVVVVAVLAVFAALIAGVVPALRATGKSMQSGLKSLGGQPQQAQLGVVWTILIVVQVAISTALLPTSAEMVWGTVRSGMLGPGFAAENFVTAKLGSGKLGEGTVDDEGDEAHRRFEQRQQDLIRRLEGNPTIAAVTVTASVPGDGPWLRVLKEDVEGDLEKNSKSEDAGGIAVGSQRVTQVNHVDESFLDVFQLPILAGRDLERADFDASRRTVLVNRAFATNVLGDGNPVGRRIRYQERKARPSTSPPEKTTGSRSSESSPTSTSTPPIRPSTTQIEVRPALPWPWP